MTNPEASRVIGQQWKQLSPHERAHYEAIAAEDKARYLKEVASTRQKVPFDSETRGRKGKAFELFCIERQGSDDPKRSVKEQKKALTAEWNALSPEQRAMYKKMSVESEKNDKKRERAATLSKKVVSKISEKDQKKRKTSQGTVLKEGANTSDTRDAKNKSVDHHLDHVDNVDAAEEAGEEEEEEVEDDVDREVRVLSVCLD